MSIEEHSAPNQHKLSEEYDLIQAQYTYIYIFEMLFREPQGVVTLNKIIGIHQLI